MKIDDYPRQKRVSARAQGWLNRPAKVLLLSIAAVLGVLDHALAGWGGPIAVAAASVIVPILYWRDFWGRISFWIATLLVTAIQVPLVIGMRPLVQQARMFYMAVFLGLDLFFVAVVIVLVAKIGQKN